MTIHTDKPSQKLERLAIRATHKDSDNLATTARAMGAYCSASDAMRTALAVSAHLARQGILVNVLAAAASDS